MVSDIVTMLVFLYTETVKLYWMLYVSDIVTMLAKPKSNSLF